MYACYFGSLALFSGLISIYLMDQGYTPSQISLVTSCSYIASMVIQPLVGSLNDHFPGRSHRITGILLIIAGLMGILFLFAKSLWSTALLYSLTLGLYQSTNPVIKRCATGARFPYRSIRIWGTLGYAAGSQLGGLVYGFLSPGSMFPCFCIGAFLCASGLSGIRDLAPSASADTARENSSRLISRPFLVYLLIACLFYGPTNLNSTYLPAMFQAQGIPVELVSTIIFTLTLSELPLIFFSHIFMDRFSCTQLLSAVFLLLILQFGVYSLIPSPAVWIAAAILTKATTTMEFIMINLKTVAALAGAARQLTALSLVATCKSFASIVFQALGGYILEQSTYQRLYLLLAAAATGLFLCLTGSLPDGRQQKLFS